MSVRYQNLNFLKRCGYQTEYDPSGEQVTIDCRTTNELPDLRIISWHIFDWSTDGKLTI